MIHLWYDMGWNSNLLCRRMDPIGIVLYVMVQDGMSVVFHQGGGGGGGFHNHFVDQWYVLLLIPVWYDGITFRHSDCGRTFW